MSVTDELRRLLDELGIEWWNDTGSEPQRETVADIGDEIAFYHENVGSIGYSTHNKHDLTPKQAITATIGRTCKQAEQGWSTEGDHARVWLTCGHDCMVPTVADLPNFCPECGAKVMD